MLYSVTEQNTLCERPYGNVSSGPAFIEIPIQDRIMLRSAYLYKQVIKPGFREVDSHRMSKGADKDARSLLCHLLMHRQNPPILIKPFVTQHSTKGGAYCLKDFIFQIVCKNVQGVRRGDLRPHYGLWLAVAQEGRSRTKGDGTRR